MLKLLPSYLFRCQGAYQKIDAIAKGHTIRQVLTGSVFLNFHHLHPEFQKFILLRIQKHYCSKKDIQSDVTFFMVMSVSVLSFPILTAWVFCNLLSMSVYLLIFFFFSNSCHPLCLFFGGLALVALLSTSKMILKSWFMLFTLYSRNGSSSIITILRSCPIFLYPSEGIH